MAFVPFGEWLPDLPPFSNPGSLTALNVVPMTGGSYGPFPAPVAAAGNPALMSACLGSYAYRDAAGNVSNFAGDKSRLYLLSPSTTGFADVSKTTGGPYGIAAGTLFPFWSATAFGDRIIFTDYADPIQTYLVGTDTKFSDLASAAPRARFCAVIRDFLMVGNTFDSSDGAQPRRVWWPAIGDPTNWPTPGTNMAIEVQSDFQDLQQTDVGTITGLVGGGLLGADGAAFCERGIYRIAYVGSPPIFDFAVSQGGVGCVAPLSIVAFRGIAYYLGEDGFYAYDGASPSIPIGAQKIDATFFADASPAWLSSVQGVAVPMLKLIFWAYCSNSAGAGGLFDRLLVYNWQLARWSLIDLSAQPIEWLARSLALGYTLDQLDQFGNLDTLPYPLDSPFWTGGRPLLGLFLAASHGLAFPAGANLAPMVDTTERQPFPERRAKVLRARPICDVGTGAAVALCARNSTFDPVAFQPAVPVNPIGWCPQRLTGRYLRARLTLPAGSAFQHLQGVDVEARPEGRLR